MAARTELLRDLSLKHLECRDYTHNWEHEWTLLGERGAVERTFTCARCSTVRTETLKRSTGELLSRSYSYPDGFQILSGQGAHGIRKHHVRREVVGRILAKEEAKSTKKRVRA